MSPKLRIASDRCPDARVDVAVWQREQWWTVVLQEPMMQARDGVGFVIGTSNLADVQ
jgi:hypothetical protein